MHDFSRNRSMIGTSVIPLISVALAAEEVLAVARWISAARFSLW